ncbi:hypothetical protein BH09PSE1_BH09PSE1_12010 [soil metagenome]
MRRLLALPLILTALATPVVAQVVPYPGDVRYGGANVTTGDVHRYEMDRLRAQAEQNQALAQSQALQTQMTIRSLQAARQTTPVIPEPVRPLTLEEARRLRETTEARTATASRSTSQIDSWLDRTPR